MQADQYTGIIPLVNTPLSLAALVVLALGTIYLVAARKNNKQVSSQVFWLIMSFGIMGNLAYFFNSWVFVDAVILGSVRDAKTNNSIPNAIIDIEGVGRVASSTDGSFQVAVPYSRQQSQYSAYAFADGYPTKELPKVDGPRPNFLSIRLDRDVSSLDRVLFLNPNIAINQILGNPVLLIGWTVKGEDSVSRLIQNYYIKLHIPTGAIRYFLPYNSWRGDRPFMDANISITENKGNIFQFVLAESPGVINTVAATFYSKFGFNVAECMSLGNWSGEEEAYLVDAFDQGFAWVPGEYKADLVVTIDNKEYSALSSFKIGEDTSQKLKAMRDRMGRCEALIAPNGMPNYAYSDGNASSGAIFPVKFNYE